jgi:3-oxoacid CoA-transferase
MRKVFSSASEAIQDVPDGATLMFGGFGLTGVPENAILALVEKGTQAITCISNEAGLEQFGLGILVGNHQIKRMICSYIGENHVFEQLLIEGKLEVELVPQGTLAERIRAGGAGIPAFFTPAGVGTEVAQNKEVRNFSGKEYLLETALVADFAFVKAWKGDADGNLVYRGTSRNFNPVMATAGKITIAEVEELVPVGSLDPNLIHTPGIYVQRIFQGEAYQKPIEHLTTLHEKAENQLSPLEAKKEWIAEQIAKEINDGDYVNLGIGIPTRVANHIPADRKVIFQSENGLLGIGPFPIAGQEDADIINASKQTITIAPGGSVFGSEESFAMIRGQHIDVTVLGGMEVSETGDLANWQIPGKMLKGMGGAMDLVASADFVVVAMMHRTPAGKSKLVSTCSLPVTGLRCVKRVVTDLGVFDVLPAGGFHLRSCAPGISVADIRAATDGRLVE